MARDTSNFSDNRMALKAPDIPFSGLFPDENRDTEQHISSGNRESCRRPQENEMLHFQIFSWATTANETPTEMARGGREFPLALAAEEMEMYRNVQVGPVKASQQFGVKT
jgi:hypothetical protein